MKRGREDEDEPVDISGSKKLKTDPGTFRKASTPASPFDALGTGQQQQPAISSPVEATSSAQTIENVPGPGPQALSHSSKTTDSDCSASIASISAPDTNKTLDSTPTKCGSAGITIHDAIPSTHRVSGLNIILNAAPSKHATVEAAAKTAAPSAQSGIDINMIMDGTVDKCITSELLSNDTAPLTQNLTTTSGTSNQFASLPESSVANPNLDGDDHVQATANVVSEIAPVEMSVSIAPPIGSESISTKTDSIKSKDDTEKPLLRIESDTSKPTEDVIAKSARENESGRVQTHSEGEAEAPAQDESIIESLKDKERFITNATHTNGDIGIATDSVVSTGGAMESADTSNMESCTVEDDENIEKEATSHKIDPNTLEASLVVSDKDVAAETCPSVTEKASSATSTPRSDTADEGTRAPPTLETQTPINSDTENPDDPNDWKNQAIDIILAQGHIQGQAPSTAKPDTIYKNTRISSSSAAQANLDSDSESNSDEQDDWKKYCIDITLVKEEDQDQLRHATDADEAPTPRPPRKVTYVTEIKPYKMIYQNAWFQTAPLITLSEWERHCGDTPQVGVNTISRFTPHDHFSGHSSGGRFAEPKPASIQYQESSFQTVVLKDRYQAIKRAQFIAKKHFAKRKAETESQGLEIIVQSDEKRIVHSEQFPPSLKGIDELPLVSEMRNPAHPEYKPILEESDCNITVPNMLLVNPGRVKEIAPELRLVKVDAPPGQPTEDEPRTSKKRGRSPSAHDEIISKRAKGDSRTTQNDSMTKKQEQPSSLRDEKASESVKPSPIITSISLAKAPKEPAAMREEKPRADFNQMKGILAGGARGITGKATRPIQAERNVRNHPYSRNERAAGPRSPQNPQSREPPSPTQNCGVGESQFGGFSIRGAANLMLPPAPPRKTKKRAQRAPLAPKTGRYVPPHQRQAQVRGQSEKKEPSGLNMSLDGLAKGGGVKKERGKGKR